MPTYEYACRQCGGFDALRSVTARDTPAECPQCAEDSPRTFIGAPRLALMAGETRRAMDVNERAKHEPQRSGNSAKYRHPPGCGCCNTSKRGATITAPNGNKAFPTKRPWMISH